LLAQNPDTGEGADELLDDLLQEHGEVVYSAGGGGSLANEADEDAECLSCMSIPCLSTRPQFCCVLLELSPADCGSPYLSFSGCFSR
jgi:hypothetical protein